MSWLRLLIHRIFGSARYHDQASEVTSRTLRGELIYREALRMRLDVRSRGKH